VIVVATALVLLIDEVRELRRTDAVPPVAQGGPVGVVPVHGHTGDE
jgi:hypothetical protein